MPPTAEAVYAVPSTSKGTPATYPLGEPKCSRKVAAASLSEVLTLKSQATKAR